MVGTIYSDILKGDGESGWSGGGVQSQPNGQKIEVTWMGNPGIIYLNLSLREGAETGWNMWSVRVGDGESLIVQSANSTLISN